MGLDFYTISTRPAKGNKIEVFPEFTVGNSRDLMVRGKDFYVVYDSSTGKWSTDKVIIQRIIDEDIDKEVERIRAEEHEKPDGQKVICKHLKDFSSNHWTTFDRFIKTLPDNYNRFKPLDSKVTYKNQKTTKSDYVTKELPYELHDGSYDAWEELISTLYDPEEREKIEWAIGAILSGDAKKIQKFLVLYGPQGSGKSTILNIVMKLLEGYYVTFKAENLVNAGDQFGCKFLASNPLVAIDEDTNLSRIETNATINKIASHEELEVNEKYKAQYVIKPMCMMMLGTNKPVRITDAKSGIIRRLIDIEPSGRKITPIRHYESLINQVSNQLGAIAYHCLEVYNDPERGPHYYDDYIPERMMYRTDAFLNFMIEAQDEILKDGDRITASRLWDKWKDYCNQSGIEFTRKRYEIIDEAKNYFKSYEDRVKVDGKDLRCLFSGLLVEKLNPKERKSRKPKLSEKIDSVVEGNKPVKTKIKTESDWLTFDQTESILDKELAEYTAQYDTGDKEHPLKYAWDKVRTKLKELDTSRTHWIKGPGALIMVDADLCGPDGKKNLDLNIQALRGTSLTPTYAELSNSGGGIHAYYWYHGNVRDLSGMLIPGVEIKTYPDDTKLSIRRRVSKCNGFPIAHISSGLPFKEEKKNVVNWEGIKDEKHLRAIIEKTTSGLIRPFDQEPKTVLCVKYIDEVLRDAQNNGIKYDLRDMYEYLYAFGAKSHHNSKECIDVVNSWDLVWPRERNEQDIVDTGGAYKEEAPIIILDTEVVNNLTLVVYKELEPDGVPAILKKPEDRLKKCVRLYNPKPSDVEKLFEMRIVGHNVIDYDNRILYSKYLGYTPQQTCELSSKIINNEKVGMYEAKNISYTDTLDVASDKKSLKKIEIEMHIPHKEMEITWGTDLPESEWERLAQYCENDVMATEAYFMSKKWQADFKARKILAALTGMTVNDSTNHLVEQLVFGDVRNPQGEFVYPDLKKEFPPYRFEFGKSYYREMVNVPKDLNFQDELQKYVKDTKAYSVVGSDEAKRTIELDVIIGEGGRVYAEPGMYYDTITFDVSGMHPSSIIVENGFGPYTKGYKDLYEARIAIKHKDYDKARKLFDGRLAPYLENEDDADDLAQALKIALNSTYGVTAAKFNNRFRDPRNIDNWVAKRGALFMEKLRLEVQKRGGHVIHIKTDSIKLVKPSQELQDFVVQFGRDHGYTFEVESKYERICLVNHAVYIALRTKDDPSWLKECAKAKKKAEETETPYIEPTRWTATGAQFAHPFVFKQLFSKEPMGFWDFCETKTVKTAMYLDFNEKLTDVEQEEKEKKKIQARIKKLNRILETGTDGKKVITDDDRLKIKAELQDLPNDIAVLKEIIKKGHDYVFVGKAGEFMPVKTGAGGGLLMRNDSDSDGKSFVTGTKGYRWAESETLQHNDRWKEYIDIRYFRSLVDEAITAIGQFGDFEMFAKGEEGVILPEERIVEYDTDPWMLPCKSEQYAYCSDCPDFVSDENGYSCKKGYTITNQILGESKEILV